MKMPRIRAARLASALLAGGVALSAVLGPAMLPADFGGSVARADLVVSVNLFQRELSPYGRWADDSRYGEVWYPSVREGWRPYYDDGHWVYSDDYGWLWVAESEPRLRCAKGVCAANAPRGLCTAQRRWFAAAVGTAIERGVSELIGALVLFPADV
jgi:hypothetical protein